MINFERNIGVKSAIGIGLVAKRVFKDVEEAADWASKFPEVYTEGFIRSWSDNNPHNDLPFFDFPCGKINSDAIQRPSSQLQSGQSVNTTTYGKLYIVKWLKENIHFEKYPNDRIGLKECKAIVDLMEQLIHAKYLSEKYKLISNDAEKIEKLVDDMKEYPDESGEHGYAYYRGYIDACNQIKRFIETLKDENQSNSTRKEK